jgi:nicotinamide-nucleotide amidase
MKHSLYLIGDSLGCNGAMQHYIERHLTQSGVTLHRRYRVADSEPVFDEPGPTPDSPHTLFLFCDPEHFARLAREIATFIGDTVTVHNESLMPASAHCVKTGYFRVSYRQLELHAINTHTGYELPSLEITPATKTATIHLFDTEHTELKTAIAETEEAYRVKCSHCMPVRGWVECTVSADAFGDIPGAVERLRERFPLSIVTDNIAKWMIKALDTAGRSVTFAESCTGGLISTFLTKESGASNVFEGALVTYSNRLKSNWIAVDEATLQAHGAVSREVVLEMSAGAMEVAGADYAIAVSGVAGPTGGSPEKPVGTVFVAVRSKTAHEVVRLQLHGDRNYIQEQTVLYAIKMLLIIDRETFFRIS